MGSFLENQYSTDKPFELGPLAVKIKKLPPKEPTRPKKQSNIDRQLSQLEAPQQAAQQSAYMNAMLGQMNNPYAAMLVPDAFGDYQRQTAPQNVYTNEEIAETLSRLSYEDIRNISDRAYQLKSMRKNSVTGDKDKWFNDYKKKTENISPDRE